MFRRACPNIQWVKQWPDKSAEATSRNGSASIRCLLNEAPGAVRSFLIRLLGPLVRVLRFLSASMFRKLSLDGVLKQRRAVDASLA
jgi:hypothetical protein